MNTQPAAATAANGGINPQNLYRYQHYLPNGALHCFLEVDEGEDEGPDKPGFETSLKLVHAMANGMDVAEYLNEEIVTQIEQSALKHRANPDHDDVLEPWGGCHESRPPARHRNQLGR